MSKFRQAIEAGRSAAREVGANSGVMRDPAGEEYEEPQLRAMGKWRFILLRGVIGFSVPMFLYAALANLRNDINSAHAFHKSALSYLLGNWIVGVCMSALFGFVIGLLAWRRLHSVWPGAEPDPESPITTLGPLSRK